MEMKTKRSVRTRIILGFVIVIVPLFFFLFYNNYYAKSVVREQVSVNYNNLLDLYVKDVDNVMNEVNYYLYQMENDPDISMLYEYNTASDDYVLTKIRVLNQLNSGAGYYNKIDSFFIYNKKSDDLTLSSREDLPDYFQLIHQQLPNLMKLKENTPFFHWITIKFGGSYALVQLYQLNPDVYVGAWMKVENLERPIASWDLGQGGGVILDSPLGTVTNSVFSSDKFAALRKDFDLLQDSYRIASAPDVNIPYLLVKKQSQFSNITFYLAVSEEHMLRKLPYFQVAVYLIPLVGIIMVGFYLFLLQRAFFKPLTELIRGMRKIGQGFFDFRLSESGSSEFVFMSAAFNNMAKHIENLKIEVYEENMKVQQAEFKHLQTQINPHFYMNSLNIIYNLAALKDYKSVQKMSLHLADYFRFTIRHNHTSVTLQEELKHVRNYLQIQQLRYPDKLNFAISVPESLQSHQIPPLALQPFVENSIIHGFMDRTQTFFIEISGIMESGSQGDELVLTIRDNGAGFAEEVLKLLQNDERGQLAEGDHLGIWNVIRRLKIYVGEKSQAFFSNEEPHGANVTLRLPLGTGEASVTEG